MDDARRIWQWLWAKPMNALRILASALGAVVGCAAYRLLGGEHLIVALTIDSFGRFVTGFLVWSGTLFVLLMPIQQIAKSIERTKQADEKGEREGRIFALERLLAFCGHKSVFWISDKDDMAPRDAFTLFDVLENDTRRKTAPREWDPRKATVPG